tara:strand:- start:1562 stop:2296 length:735 start_codon:yes stop_codon:yes gene_type:complete
MRKILFSICIIAFALNAHNQNFQILVDDKVYQDGDTIKVYGDPSSNIFSLKAIFYNNTVNGANIKVAREEVSIYEGVTNYFKWGEPYSTETDTSLKYLFVPAGGVSPDDFFEAYVNPNNTIGSSIIKYVFYNLDYESEQVSVFVEFNTIAFGIDDYFYVIDKTLNIYPNPSTGSVSIDYDAVSSLNGDFLYNINSLQGNVLKKGIIERGESTVELNLSYVPKGIYLVTIIYGTDIIVTKKLVLN